MSKHETKVLAELAQQCAETRRPVATLIVMAACNARSTADQDRVLLVLASLKRQGLVSQQGDQWAATPAGRKVAAGEPAPSPSKAAEKPKPASRPRDTLRPRVGGAPRPVTRPVTPPECPEVDAFRAGRIPEAPAASTTSPLPADLLQRCAAMQLALMDDVRRRYDAGEPGALDEMAWLRETGRMIVGAGGEHA